MLYLLSAHTWLIIGLCSLPLLIWIPLRVLDADRPPDNEIRHEQDDDSGRDDDLGDLLAAA